MRKFLLNISLFFGLLFLADRAGNMVLQQFRPVDYKQFLESKQQFFSENKSYDVLIIGDSHIADALDSRIIEKNTGLSCFNLGIYHSSPYENYYTLKAALEHQSSPPRILVIGTNPVMFFRERAEGKYTPLIISGICDRWQLYWNSEHHDDYGFISKTIREKYLITSMRKKLTGEKYKPTREITVIYNGYLESKTQTSGLNWVKSTKEEAYRKERRDQLDYFRRSIELARQKHMKVVLVNTPLWSTRKESYNDKAFREFSDTLRKISSRYGIPLFNAGHDLLSDSLAQTDFLNTEHLNYSGAVKFTSAFAEWLNTNK